MASNKKSIDVNSSPFKKEGGGTPFLDQIATPMGIALSLGSSIFGALTARKQEKAAARKAEKERKKMKELEDIYNNIDTSNPYLNLENTMEDLTVNQQQSQFEKQQFQQSQANVLEGLRGAAGGSGIAALAQSLAQQGQLAAQRSSASIGQQEAANQRAERQQASQIQGMEREGELIRRRQEREKQGTMLGMSQQRLAAHEQARGAAQEAKWGAIGGGITGAANMFAGFSDDLTVTPGGIVGSSGAGTGDQTSGADADYWKDKYYKSLEDEN